MPNETEFPADGRRIIVYLLYDARGLVDDYVPYKLERLRPFADRILVVVNGALTDAGRATLEGVADDVLQRENVGYDVGGYSAALDHLGDELAEYDELILMNYTWFGPVRPLEPLFERMDREPLGFWGLTDHGPITPHPLARTGTMPAHIQSHWIAVRRSLFLSPEWREYWRDMPPITSYDDSILWHESRFTKHFADRGHPYRVAFSYQDYPPSTHPAFLNARELLDDGCPALKRRPFFHDPLYLDREAIIGRLLVDSATSQGYPERFIWQSMSRTSQPRVLYTNASMMEILPSSNSTFDPERPPSVVAVVHIYYDEMTVELLDRLTTLPVGYDLVVTTSDEQKAERIRAVIAERADPAIGAAEVRVVESNRGRDQSAFYVTCRDVLLDDRYDLVVKIHSKRSVQDGEAGEFFKRQQFDNLLLSPEYTAGVLGLFQRESGLGAVFPPMIHIGFPTMGNAWFTNKPLAERVAKRMGLGGTLDEASPLAPYGGMFIARTAALRPLAETEWTFDEYAEEGSYGDGTLSHVQERLVASVAADGGFHSRSVANAEYAAISHTFLEYKLDRMSEGIPGSGHDQVHRVNSVVEILEGGRVALVKYVLLRYFPRTARGLVRVRQFVRPRRGEDRAGR